MIPLCVDQISFCCLLRNSRPESGRLDELINVKKNLRFSDLAVFLPKAWWRRQTLICFISTHAQRAWVSKHFPWRLDCWELFITSVMDTCVSVYVCVLIYCWKPLRVISQSSSPLSFTSFSSCLFGLSFLWTMTMKNKILKCFTASRTLDRFIVWFPKTVSEGNENKMGACYEDWSCFYQP